MPLRHALMRVLVSVALLSAEGCDFASTSVQATQEYDRSDFSSWEPDLMYRTLTLLEQLSRKKLDEPRDLNVILGDHELWLDSSKQSGRRAILVGQLHGANLHEANLHEAGTLAADLTRADLGAADLTGATLYGANLTRAHLGGADLTGADLLGVNLTDANLTAANLTGVKLRFADLTRTIFEPTSNPETTGMALAANLELVTYAINPGPLTEMRTAFKSRGFRDAERKVTFALKRRETELLLARCRGRRWALSTVYGPSRIGACSFYLLNRVAFDLPSQYGMNPTRPLAIMAALWLACVLVYARFIQMPGSSGLYLIVRRSWKGKEQVRGVRIAPRAMQARRRWFSPLSWLGAEWRVLRAAMMFSLMSAFNIGFRDINFGRWIRLLMKREYDIRPVGWARTVSGVQSLATVYLVGLWVLTYFGRPFE